ncbi:MAG: hypothetical protein WA957_11085 [Alteraurantiacibacter sp.]
MKFATAAIAALMLSACANSALTVEQPYRGAQKFSTAMVQYDASTVGVDDENIAYTTKKMEQALFGGDTPVFSQGSGLTVRYRYVGFDEGSRFGRYLSGGLAGGSKVVLETEFVSPTGEVLATVRGEGTVGGGLAGGSNKTGIDKAVEKVADYAAANFK